MRRHLKLSLVLMLLLGRSALLAHDHAAEGHGATGFKSPHSHPHSHAVVRATATQSADATACANAEMVASTFAPFKPKVRYYWDNSYFFVESDGLPDTSLMPGLMVGITSWQQQIPLPTSYFAQTINPERSTGSIGFGKPNVWKLPLIPLPSASPIPISAGNFQRGAIAIAVNGIPIFNPRNNRGEFSQAIGELDQYGGHCGLADDYHYHIAPIHLQSVVGAGKPVAWALDGYAIFGYAEPDGSPRQPLDTDGGHIYGEWGYHYHAIGSASAGPQSPYLMNAFHGTVVNFGGQVDGQPEVSPVRAQGTGGYEAKALAGARITEFKNPVSLTTDATGNLIESLTGVPSPDEFLMRYTVGTKSYDLCWRIQRQANPKSLAITWRLPSINPTTTTYASVNNRLTSYPMATSSLGKIPDTGQTLDATKVHGEDSDYDLNPMSYRDNGDGTITDNVTGLMWQKTDSGEMTWENATVSAGKLGLGGFTDWRLPTPMEAFSILNHNNNPALNTTYFTSPAGNSAEYWWTSDTYGNDATKVWVSNSGGGLGPHPKTETLSAGGTHRFHARFVRGARPSNGHSYQNNCDGTITDLDTGLMWTQVQGAGMNWTSALAYAESLTTAGYTDWRLPNIKELQSLVDFTLATGTGTGVAPCLNRTLFTNAAATACWSSTVLRSGTPSQAWLVEFGISPNVPSASGPPRGFQGIVSYENFASSYPVLAVRTVPASSSRSVTQGRATTTITNLLAASSPGARTSAVGTITSRDGTQWTVPASTQFGSARKAPDLYNELTGVTPADISGVNLANIPVVEIDPDGELITGYLFADNYFELYVNGVLVGVDPVPYTPFNSCVVRFKAKRPVHYAVRLVDWEENLGLGTELNGGNPFHAGDGGFMASFSDGTVTDKRWKAQSFYISPLDDPGAVVEKPDGTHDSSAIKSVSTLGANAFALHYPLPQNWFASSFDDSAWPYASTYTEAVVGIDNKPAYQNFPAQFGSSGAQFIWSSNLVLDNEVVVRFTGPGPVQNTAPTFSKIETNRYVISGGDAFVTTRAAVDTDSPAQSLTYSLPLAPAGATIDSSSGLISWRTSASHAGTSNAFEIVVTDNGIPQKSATNFFNVFVRSSKPNVVIIVTDDHGYNDISAHGAEVRTPNMDRLGSEGIRLERFYATPVCSITRAALMTGRNTIRTGVNNSHGLDLHEHILPQTFKAAGYQTFMCGKWHLGGLYNTETNTLINGISVPVIRENADYQPQNRGWDVHYGEYTGAINYSTHISQENGKLDWWLNGQPSLDSGWSTDLLADKAIQLLKERDPSKPVMLYLAFNAVHGPVSAPPEYLARYSAVPNANRRNTLAALDHMDVAMGRLLNAIDSEGLRTNTLVTFFGDNGGQASSGGSNLPLRGDKGDLYDGAIHTPAAIRWPGVLPTGITNSQQFVWVGDWFPTICAATGVTPLNNKPFDGINLWPALLKASNGPFDSSFRRGAPLVSGSSAGSGIFEVFPDANGIPTMFKLIRDKLAGAGAGFSSELFDIIKDPYETTDLSKIPAYSGILTTLTSYYETILPESYPPYIGVHPESQTVKPGGNLTLWALTTVYPKSISCQWRRNGINIPGATNYTQVDASVFLTRLDLTNVSPGDAGSYDLVVTDKAVGWPTTATSQSAIITVQSPTNPVPFLIITNVVQSVPSPSPADPVSITARTAGNSSGTSMFLHYTQGTGQGRTNLVFQETMASASIKPWTGTLCDNTWTVSFSGTNPFEQRTGANSGTGGPNGLEFKAGTVNLADSMITPAQSVDARGGTGSVEFWLSANGLTGEAGWTFQIDSGKGYTTRLSELTASNHAFQLYHYDLQPDELVGNLKVRWQFRGGNNAHRIDLDQISVRTTSPDSGYTEVGMLDDGRHQDGALGDGVFGALIPPAPLGTTVSYYITASDASGLQAVHPATAPNTTLSYIVKPAPAAESEFDVLLGRPTSSSIAVSLLARSPMTAYLEYGTETGVYGSKTTTVSLQSGIPITLELDQLLPDQKYYYRLRYSTLNGPTLLAGPEHFFHTQRTPGSSFTFVVEADPHHRDNEPQVWQRALTNMLADQPDFLIDLGDTFMDEKVGATNAYYLTKQGILDLHNEVRTGFFSILGHSVPTFLVNGNHDAELGWLLNGPENPAVWGVQARHHYFPVPAPGGFYSGAAEGDPFTFAPRDGYYAFHWGDALFVILDPFWYTTPKPQQNGWNWTLGAHQYDWLKRTLETSQAKFKFVFAHHLVGGGGGQEARGGKTYGPYYEWGGSNSDGSPGFATQRPGWPAPIRDLLVTNKVQIFFHGHDHLFVKEDEDVNGDGLTDLIYQEVPQPSRTLSNTNSAIGYGYTNSPAIGNSGHLRVTVTTTNALVEYVRVYLPSDESSTKINRAVSYRYNVPASGRPTVHPPIRLTASLSRADLILRWNAEPGYSYSVQRSVDLVNWTTIPVGPTNTWTDLGGTGLAEKRFYRVMP